MRWQLFIEEYSLDLQYIKGSHNVVADALSWLPKEPDSPLDNSLQNYYIIMECHAMATPNYNFHLLSVAHLAEAQQRNSQIKKELQQDNTWYQIKNFHGGGGTRSLVCYKDKIVVPKKLQKHVVDWYHTVLCHLGINRTEESVAQHLFW
jgi:hypothetical protein